MILRAPKKALIRPRLLERLEQGLLMPLTVVSAPAGAGKTTLLSQWVQGRSRPVAWLTLAAADGEPARFLPRLASSLQAVPGGLGARLLAGLPTSQGAQEALAELLNEAAQADEDWVLILDNLQAVEGSLLGGLAAPLLDYLPPQVHIYLAGRAEPDLPLGRLRVRGQLLELGWGELNFTPDEAEVLLQSLTGDLLSPGQVAALLAHTEGWALGLVRAAQALREYTDAGEFLASFSGRHWALAGYLTETVLLRQPADVQAFLLQTAPLERLSAALCNAVTGRGDGQAMLEWLERHNLFVIPLDEERRAYRYHRLFAEFLRG